MCRPRVGVLVNGVDLTTLAEDELALLRSEEIGFIFQSHHLLDGIYLSGKCADAHHHPARH